jgi:hypothetical protein
MLNNKGYVEEVEINKNLTTFSAFDNLCARSYKQLMIGSVNKYIN